MQAANSARKTIGDIVAADFRTATVFENHGIDFCCGGKATLAATCTEKRLDLAGVTREAVMNKMKCTAEQGLDSLFVLRSWRYLS